MALGAIDGLDELRMQQQRLDASIPERDSQRGFRSTPVPSTGAELPRGPPHAARLAQPHRDAELHLADIEAGGAGVYHMYLGTVADCGCHGVFP